MAHLDYLAGRRHADETLTPFGRARVQVALFGENDWRNQTAKHLIKYATQRQAEGINPDFQRGVIERAKEFLK